MLGFELGLCLGVSVIGGKRGALIKRSAAAELLESDPLR